MNNKKKLKPLNSRQRRFCLFHHSGMTQEQAYVKAGYSPGGANQGSSDLMRFNPMIKAELERLSSLQSNITLDTISKTVMAPLERRQRLSEIARGRLVDFTDQDNEPHLDKDTPNNGAAREYSTRVRSDKEGGVTVSKTVKLNNPVEAIQELNKMGGDYAPSKHLVAGQVIFEVRLVDKRKRQGDGGEE